TAIGMSDTTAFNSCIRDSVPMTIIRHDEDDARRIGVQVTPTLLLDDERIDGAVPVRTLSEMIQKHFKKAGTR
ncbi:MAG: thioredoxin domain-containing protein, partial [bacterium]